MAIDGVEACNGDPTVLTADFTTWGSDNTGVAKVSYAKVQAVAAGSTTGYADGLVQVPGACGCNFVPTETYVPSHGDADSDDIGVDVHSYADVRHSRQ